MWREARQGEVRIVIASILLDLQLKTENSQRFLAEMAAQVRSEYSAGQTEPLEKLLDDDEAADHVASPQ
jgi:ATP-dependent exoDNAse (exonuclease V) alpha subunit